MSVTNSYRDEFAEPATRDEDSTYWGAPYLNTTPWHRVDFSVQISSKLYWVVLIKKS